ncbi:hypothetical protein [Prevotella histicola]|uniref:DUF3278 domain-containing protein n=1 Tax=Prevotella histicola JCM 15637 = DNF00424 TaxID=1236504 RepID=A0AAW3FFD5_9BACT|nr:hypothetical protein [Prevotella histicola]KGF26575.1 hypothetical protein HMPREF2132_07475 [Prevotella histicola JCM 15637 = DNF00424]
MEIKNNELEEMRQQLGILKEKIDGQKLINDNLIRQSMLNKMSFMKKYTWVSFLVLLFIYYVYNDIRITFNLSWWFYGATVIFMTFSVCFDAYINRFNKESFLNGDLIATSLQMQRMKKLRKRSLLYGIFFMTIWVSWFVIELYNGSGAANGGENTSMFYGMLVGGGVGLIAGVAIGIWLYLRMQRINSDIISQIEELTKE